MKQSDYTSIFFLSCKALFHKSILKLTIISFVLSIIILSTLLFMFWNIFPSIQWIKIIFWGVFDELLNSIWFYIISTLFILLFPSLSTIVSGFFLDSVSHKTNLLLGNKYPDNSSYATGIISGIRILGLSIIVFFITLILKWTIIQNIYIVLLIQLLASGYILSKEYYEIVALKIFSYSKIPLFKKKNFLSLNVFGIAFSIFFMLPLINLIAPILSIILMTVLVDKLNKKKSPKINFITILYIMQKKKKYLDLILYPNCSLDFKSLFFLSIIFTILSLLISLYFINNGAWPVGVFLFLDLLIILMAFKINYKRAQRYERIIISENLLIKKINFRGIERTIKIEPTWLRLKVYCNNNKGHLEIISKGKSQIIGNYLNIYELKKLAKEIKKALIMREKEIYLNF